MAFFPNKMLVPRARVLIGSLAAVACGLGLGLGCGGDSSATADAGAMLSSCATETRAIAYTPNLARMSASGAFKAVLVKSVPGPPAEYSNDWTVQILDANGAPVDGLTMTGLPRMPDHTHPTSVIPVVTPKGGGLYDVSPVFLFMPGYWETTLTLQPATGAKDTVMFPFCIPS
jgi:hypothetical protein